MTTRKRYTLLPVACAVACLMTAGCGGSQDAEKTKALTVEQQIQRIQSDPNMPQEAKMAAVQQLQAQAGTATAKQSLLPKK